MPGVLGTILKSLDFVAKVDNRFLRRAIRDIIFLLFKSVFPPTAWSLELCCLKR